ncbi:TATA element modulatory factor-like [Macrosteles quadrilineatus]|uniref:TATA element modulatory factor-like n=1 Tax=Macrosteles quadrilineatus TaxID=74068 RepID=UPI0023E1DE27|nr:TATA element modulatory factor-like [Macrosteles quadrilineatus]
MDTMSWFDATGFANLAKTALKEAQKTIDKALDIKEEDIEHVTQSSLTSPGAETEMWVDQGVPRSESEPKLSSSSKLSQSGSLWGSFTGSFFENPKLLENDAKENPETPSRPTNFISNQPKKTATFQPPSASTANTSPSEAKTPDPSCPSDIREEILNFPPVVYRKKEPRNYNNRLSAISSESDRRSSSSCEVLGSCTPDSDPQHSLSTSSSVVRLRQSGSFESVEVLTSPSSVEVLGSTASEHRYSSDSISPIAEGEGPPELVDDSEPSVAEDSYTSASETLTAGTVLDLPQASSTSRDLMSASTTSRDLMSTSSTSRDLMLKSTSSLDTSFTEPPRDSVGSECETGVSSCEEGTLMASSGEETTLGTSTSTSYLTNLLADAMTEQPPHREHSPISSERCEEGTLMASSGEETTLGTSTSTSYLTNLLADAMTEQPPHREHSPISSERCEEGTLMASSGEETTLGTSTSTSYLTNLLADAMTEQPPHREHSPISSESHEEGTLMASSGEETTLGTSTSTSYLTNLLADAMTEQPPHREHSPISSEKCEEGTLMASSGEETTLGTSTSTSYLTNLLADAMTEQPPHREHSPISSESRSDMIKIGSSGHTSGDELETTTSSDIEIISSPTPNGDSSSAASRQSPARLSSRSKMSLVAGTSHPEHSLSKVFAAKVKGHQRELSEASSGGSDDGSEVDKLHKRISEMTEILEVREAKLIDLSRLNSDLQETNGDLRRQLESGLQKQDVSELSEEFTQRLAALERKFQQAIRDKELLRKQLEQARAAAAVAEEEAEKDQVISDLRAEGEKLSKQQLALNNIIKKLRATERDNQKTISSLKEQLEECTQEVDRTKKALSAKQDVERSQIEAVHQLTRTNNQLENQLTQLQSQVENLTSTIVSLQKELTDSKDRVTQLQLSLKEAKSEAEAEVRRRLEGEWGEVAEQRDSLEAEVTSLRDRLDQQLELHDKEVRELRTQHTELLRRLETAGAAAEEVAQSVSAATQPLVRQIHTLTAQNSQNQAAWERQERSLLQQINELQSRVTGLVEAERGLREQLMTATNRGAGLEAKLSAGQRELEATQELLTEAKDKLQLAEREKDRLVKEHEESLKQLRSELCESERDRRSLEQQLSVERAALEAERRKTAALQEQTKMRGQSPPTTPRSSPTLSLGRLSVCDSTASNMWPGFGDDVFETASMSGRMSVYDSLRPGNTTSLLEGLQAQLKQREGEVHQLQWELSRREVERAALSNELAALTGRVEVQDKQLAALSTLQTEYDALLLLYGEKLEESQELRMDLQDVKDMYKTQIDQLLKKEEPST